MEEVLGQGHNVLSVQNGLLLYSSTEKLFEDGLIKIVPSSEEEGETGLKVRVLEGCNQWLESPLIKNGTLLMKDLHDPPPQLKNEKRPKKRYMYFMYLVRLLRCEEKYRHMARKAEMERSKRVFSSLTPSMRASMVRRSPPIWGMTSRQFLNIRSGQLGEEMMGIDREDTVHRYFECVKDLDDWA